MRSEEHRPNNVAAGRAKAAFLGAAIGDALGWPYEDRARRTNAYHQPTGPVHFEGWVRRSGGRFLPHNESISPGEYSDDTQLILATARSLLTRKDWWNDLAFVELPMWSAYERGGGGATKHAVRLLIDGTSPWKARKDAERDRYFNAGGNGVAMRVLPHSVVCAGDDGFSRLAGDVVADGVCTHGHPRALVGALATAYAQWSSFRRSGPLGYGEMIHLLLDSVGDWARLPDIASRWSGWREAAERDIGGQYINSWNEAVSETVDKLRICAQALEQGALAVDHQTLTRIGCFDKRSGGAGTTTACASIFIASRYAAAPLDGVALAARMYGTDTDTIASICGSLFGALAGMDWLLPFLGQLQDASYIAGIAEKLSSLSEPTGIPRPRVRRYDLDKLKRSLLTLSNGVILKLPDGRSAHVQGPGTIELTSAKVSVTAWRVQTDDGQTLFLKDVRRATSTSRVPTHRELPLEGPKEGPPLPSQNHYRVGLRIVVTNLEKSLQFYSEILGLPVTKRSERSVSLAGALILQARTAAAASAVPPDGHSVMYIEVPDVHECRRRLGAAGIPILEQHAKSGRAVLVCRDPDGNRVEIVEHSPAEKK